MATIQKNFKIKNGLVVEGSTGTIGGYDVLTKKTDDQNYIIGLIGGSATSNATANTVVLRDADANFAANVITADLVGDVTGQVSDISNFDTDDLAEGTTNKYFTEGRAQTALAGMYDPAGSAANALSDAEDYADTVSGYALGNAQSYADSAASNALADAEDYADGLASNYDPAGSAANAYSNATSYADSAAANALSDAQDYADSAAANAQSAAEDYADGLAAGYEVAGAAANAYSNATSYADSAISNAIADLVDSAPALLDTLNEIAASIGDDANFVGTITNLVAEKQNTLIAGTDIDITGNTISFNGSYDPLGSAANAYSNATSYADSAASNALADAEDYADGLAVNYDPAGSAANAYSNATSYADSAASNAQAAAEDYADGLAINYDAAGAAANAYSNAVSYVDTEIGDLTTTDIEEGTNEYFTDTRAKTSAADLLTNATLTNITITGNSAGLVITAENGVADSDTDDLTEGTTNLYFTDQRAVDALEAVVPNFTEVEIDSLAKVVAATLSAPTAGVQTAFSWVKEDYRSAEFLVKVAYSTHTEVSKVLLTLDSSDNIAITEYAIVGTNGSAATISADINSGNVRLLATTANNNSTVTVVGTLLV
jgi:hypothetical protein